MATKKKIVKKRTVKKHRRNGITIRDKDQKLLWGNAASRCSMRECRTPLTININDGKSSTLGEMCHIVGEKKAAARGKSNLSLVDRNQYSNLILLCAHHHKTIDRYEAKYTIELLHKIKTDHEIWVNETLSAKTLTPDELVYSALIDHLSLSLRLEYWSWFIDNSVRQLVHTEFIDAADSIKERQLATIWPNTKPELELTTKVLMQAYADLSGQYLSFATLPSFPFDRDFFQADTSYKQTFPNPHYHYYSDKHSLWARKNFLLLCIYVIRLNEFAEAVRKYSNPLFYVVRGKFLVIDNLGTHLGNWGAMLDPALNAIESRLKAIDIEISTFEKKYKGKEPLSAR